MAAPIKEIEQTVMAGIFQTIPLAVSQHHRIRVFL